MAVGESLESSEKEKENKINLQDKRGGSLLVSDGVLVWDRRSDKWEGG